MAVLASTTSRRERANYRQVWADRVFVRVAATNLAFVAAAVSLLNGVFPGVSDQQAQTKERVIGVLFLLNSLVIVAFQLRIARAVEGRRRGWVLAGMGGLSAASWLFVAVAGSGLAGQRAAAGMAGSVGRITTVGVLVIAVGVFSLAECLYDAVQGPMVADLAPRACSAITSR